jgi:hypothetical protein
MASVMRFDQWQDSNGVPVATGAGGKFSAPGAILQVVSTSLTAPISTSVSTGGTFVDVAGFSASITPTSSSSRIVCMVTVSHNVRTSGNTRAFFRMLRDSTVIGAGDAAGNRTRAFSGYFLASTEDVINSVSTFVDSPNTTSAITYKVQTTSSAASTVFVNRTEVDSDNVFISRTASHLTLLEVAG